MKVRIIKVSRKDHFYKKRKYILGMIDEFTVTDSWGEGWYGGEFGDYLFHMVKIEEIKDKK